MTAAIRSRGGRPKTIPSAPANVTSTGPLRIRTRGSSTDIPARCLDSYVPAIGDYVAYVKLESQVLVIGAIDGGTGEASGTGGGAGVTEFFWSSYGDLQVESPVPLKIYNDTGVDLTVVKVRAALGSASSGADVVLNVVRDGVANLFAAGLIVPAGVLTVVQPPDSSVWESGSYLEVSIDQVGSILPGANLVITVVAL